MWHCAAFHHTGDHSHCLESSRCRKKDFVPSRPVLATSTLFQRFQALLGSIADRKKNFLGLVPDSSDESFFKVFAQFNRKRDAYKTSDEMRMSMAVMQQTGGSAYRHLSCRG
jgi:hypothetical protein